MAFALPVFSIDKLAKVNPTLSHNPLMSPVKASEDILK